MQKSLGQVPFFGHRVEFHLGKVLKAAHHKDLSLRDPKVLDRSRQHVQNFQSDEKRRLDLSSAPNADANLPTRWGGSVATSRWPRDRPTDKEIDRAGRVLRDEEADPQDVLRALEIVRRWRSTHAFPLNTIQMSLRSAGHLVAVEAVVAQRLKRMESITAKLNRPLRHSLHEMQDIAGCRCVVPTVADVSAVVARMGMSRRRHKLFRPYDYIQRPKPDGYRSHHLVYEYHSDRNSYFNGMRIEVQVRSQLQHSWATAIETMGTFRGELLKAGEGNHRWLRFFQLVSSAFAILESCSAVPGTPCDPGELVAEIKYLAADLRVVQLLKSYQATLKIYGDVISQGPSYFLVESEPYGGTIVKLRVTRYSPSDLTRANAEYAAAEAKLNNVRGASAVLVSTGSLKQLQQMYPNYYADTNLFVKRVEEILEEGIRNS